MIAPLLEKMAVFVVLMVLGYVLVRTGTLSKSFAGDASRLVVNVFVIATIINSVITMDNRMTGRQLLLTIGVLTMSILVSYVVAAIVCRTLPLEDDNRPVYELIVCTVNNMLISLPVLDSLFGSTAVFYCSLSCLPFNAIMFTYNTSRLRLDGSNIRIKDVFSAPFIATLIALLVFVIHPPVPGVVRTLFSSTAGATLPMSMLMVGASLGSVSLKDTFNQPKLYLMCFFKLIVCPLIAWVLAGLMTDDIVLRASAMLIAAAPAGIMATALSLQYGRDSVLASRGVLLSTALSMITMPALVFLLL